MGAEQNRAAIAEMLAEGDGGIDVALFQPCELVDIRHPDPAEYAAWEAICSMCRGERRGCLFCDRAFVPHETDPPAIIGVMGPEGQMPRRVLVFMLCDGCVVGGQVRVLRQLAAMVKGAAESDENALAWMIPAGSA